MLHWFFEIPVNGRVVQKLFLTLHLAVNTKLICRQHMRPQKRVTSKFFRGFIKKQKYCLRLQSYNRIKWQSCLMIKMISITILIENRKENLMISLKKNWWMKDKENGNFTFNYKFQLLQKPNSKLKFKHLFYLKL